MAKNKQDPVEFIQGVVGKANIAGDFKPDVLRGISEDVLREYRLDKGSMSEWFEQMEKGIELAKMVKSDQKDYPFKRSSNVCYPLVTSAALQFNARAYPAICDPVKPVKAKVHGEDAQGVKAARGERVSSHMSYQLTSKMDEWEEQTDKLLVQLPIVGEMFRKVWYDPAKGRTCSRLIEPGKLIINDKTRAISDAPRASEEIDLYPIEISERERDGRFIAVDYDEDDNDKQKPEEFIEQHRRMDLDGDGYEEPYIVTLHKTTEKVVRIVADFEEHDIQWETEQQVIEEPVADPESGLFQMVQRVVEVPVGVASIKRGSYFVDYQFMPGMDGGFHGTGLGLLLGDISQSINSIMNMLLDAGHMSSLGGGFIGAKMRLKGGASRFQPGEWKQVGANGMDIRNSIVPMTFPQPDATLFQMLGMLIEAGREIGSVQDVITGDSGGKQMTATATLALIDQGLAVFSAIYKRIFRSLKKEFKLLANLNSMTISPEEYNMFHDSELMFDPAQEYAMSDMDIEPVADPQSVTNMQKAAKAQLLMEMAGNGLVDPVEASKRMVEAANIGDVEELAPKPDPMAEQMGQMQMQMEGMKLELEGAKTQSAQVKANADMVKAQADLAVANKPESPLEAAKAQAELETQTAIRRMELEQEAQLERERIASQERVAAEDRLAEMEIKRLDLMAQATQPEGESQSNELALQAVNQMIETMTAQVQAMNGPKEVVRDEQGRIKGVRPVMQ